jgi:Tfp pilus assembly protein PilF
MINDKAFELAIQYYNSGDFYHAEHVCREILGVEPGNSNVLNFLGNIFYKLGNFDEAIKCYQNAIQINPNIAMLYNNLGAMYKEKNQLDDAITYYRKALELDPSLTYAYYNLGFALQKKGQLDDAVKSYQKSIQLNPNLAESYTNIGSIFYDQNRVEEAIGCHQKAIQIKPDLAMAHWNLSHALLLSGDFEQGWKEYEWGWNTKGMLFNSNFSLPLWEGQSLENKTLFIGAEQGVGDEIMFASCLPDIIDRANLCIVECDKRLVPLFSRSFPRAIFVERIHEGNADRSSITKADFWIPIGSLPGFFRRDLTEFPQQMSYLIADSKRVQRWKERFDALGGGLKAGISWRGGQNPGVIRTRSLTLEQCAGLFLLPGMKFINLQYGDYSEGLKEVHERYGITIFDWEDADPLKNLDDFAAQIALLDLVISVDNSTVHMAGALGVPVWTLLPYNCEWRWMRNYEDTPWYKTVRLLRQTIPGDWDSVFQRILSGLGQWIKNGHPTDINPQNSYKIKAKFQIKDS